MTPVLVVFLGAGIGGVLRHLVNVGTMKLLGTGFPAATLLINVSGSLIMGIMAGWFVFRDGEAWTQTLRLFLTTGIMGGYTTFSTFSLDFLILMERHDYAAAALYVTGSIGLSFAAVFAGMALVRAMT